MNSIATTNSTGIAADTGQLQWSTPSHDAAGNMVTMPKPSAPANSITAKYDAWNRLVEVTDSGILIAKFKYDATGRRILKAFDEDASGTLDRFDHIYLDGQQVIETREITTESTAPETIQPKHQNIWSPRYIDALILRDENTDTDTLCDDTRLYYLSDANHNVTALIDTTGNILERYIYTPYGTATILDPNFTPDADNISDHSTTTLYTGRELDPATGLIYYRARHYHPQLGRFTTRDPIGYDAGDVNLYRYVAGRPLTAVDPLGEALKWAQSLVGQPQLHGSSGFSMQVKQELSGGTAVPGTQVWQTNDVKFIALIGKDNKCEWDDRHHRRLDVHFPKGTPPYTFIDTISSVYNPKVAGVCFLFITMTRKHGLRPFNVAAGKITFSTDPLPQGSNYEATKEQWALATQNMAEKPILKSSVNYIFVDRDVCRCFPKADQEKVAKIVERIWGDLDPSISSAAFLSYSDLGQWPIITGHSSP